MTPEIWQQLKTLFQAAIEVKVEERASFLAAACGGDAELRSRLERLLASHEGAWDDGDENLVRGYLDRWIPQGDDPLVAAARGLSEAAVALAGLRARPETLWFFLWEMESMLAAVADNPGRPC